MRKEIMRKALLPPTEQEIAEGVNPFDRAEAAQAVAMQLANLMVTVANRKSAAPFPILERWLQDMLETVQEAQAACPCEGCTTGVEGAQKLLRESDEGNQSWSTLSHSLAEVARSDRTGVRELLRSLRAAMGSPYIPSA